MQKSTDWMPSRLADLLVMFQNIFAKIGGYESVLPLTSDQVKRIQLICNEFIAIYNYVEQAQATTKSLTEWRDFCWKGSPVNDPAPMPPVYPTYNAVANSFIGIFVEFRDLREAIVAAANYTQAIGEDLMIVAIKSEGIAPSEMVPSLKVSTATGYKVNISGSMQGMDAMRVEYLRKGSSEWVTVAFLTKLPAEFTITPAAAGVPEIGNIRAIYIQKNADVGNFSPQYEITIS